VLSANLIRPQHRSDPGRVDANRLLEGRGQPPDGGMVRRWQLARTGRLHVVWRPALLAERGDRQGWATQTVFWQAPNHHLYEAWYTGSWNGPIDLTAMWGGVGPLSSAPTAMTTADGSQMVFWRGPDNRLWEAWYSGGAWHGPADLVGLGILASTPSVTVTPDGSTQLVFWKGTNGLLSEAWFTGRWNSPVQFGNYGGVASAPSVTVTPDRLTQLVFWQGTDNHLHEAWFTGWWNGPIDSTAAAFRDTSPLSSAPSATVTTDGGTQVVFWAGPGGLVYEAWWAAARWNGPVAVEAS
jgi:hypothetical protein